MENLVMSNAEEYQNDVLEQVKAVATNRKERRVMTSIVKNVIKKAKVQYKVVTVEEWMKLYL